MTALEAWNELDVGRFKSELYRSWYAGYHAGLEHPRILATTDDFSRCPSVKRLRKYLLEGTKRRQTLAALTRGRPELFAPFESALLNLGEESGALEACLKLLADYFAAEHRMIIWVKKKLSYPMFQAVSATFIGPLPLIFLGHTDRYLMIVVGGLGALFIFGGTLLKAAARWYGNRGAYVRGRLARALTLGVEAGLPLGRVVELAVDASASPAIRAHVARFPKKMVSSQPLAKTFAGCPGVPREMIATMEVADASGNYGETLKRLADLYDGGYS